MPIQASCQPYEPGLVDYPSRSLLMRRGGQRWKTFSLTLKLVLLYFFAISVPIEQMESLQFVVQGLPDIVMSWPV